VDAGALLARGPVFPVPRRVCRAQALPEAASAPPRRRHDRGDLRAGGPPGPPDVRRAPHDAPVRRAPLHAGVPGRAGGGGTPGPRRRRDQRPGLRGGDGGPGLRGAPGEHDAVLPRDQQGAPEDRRARGGRRGGEPGPGSAPGRPLLRRGARGARDFTAPPRRWPSGSWRSARSSGSRPSPRG
jgi:hypothetical protein